MRIQIIVLISGIAALIFSCSKKNSGQTPSPPVAITDTTTIKGITGLTTGVAISFNLMKNNTSYSTLVKNQFDRVTFEYQMKHAPNVQNDGNLNFTNTDELVDISLGVGLKIFGHTLIWHQNNNAVYLRSLNNDVTAVHNTMQNWISSVVTRYKGKVTGWDVVNEAFTDDGSLRTGVSSNDVFYWYAVLGRSYIADAFTYAGQADPDALLFINDYNLELNPVKLDSLLKMVGELKAMNVPIHGIGTQMHININTPNSGIDNMFTKLAATGLKIHVSELDVRINPNNTPGFAPTATLLEQQAAKFRYVAESYKRHVPADQQFGITVWNLTDADSWIVAFSGNTDYPTLFDKFYKRKPAFTQFREGLRN